ncbi:MAG: hypothetical protein JWM25_14, partial [Thermoleophilia bacterium]|nr:hypothetical protein [Thermoleophilia bacterium]
MTSINSNSVIPLGQPGVAPAPTGIAPHEAADAVTGGGGVEETGGGTGAYFDADADYYSTPDYRTVPDRSAAATTNGGGATTVAPTLADFEALGIFTEADLAKISAANLSPSQLTELFASASGTPAPTVAATPAARTAATTGPTVEDFAKLGVFSEADLAQISAAKLSPSAAIALYEQTVAHFQSPAGQAELQARAKAIDPVAGGGPVGAPGEGVAAPASTDVANQPVTELAQLTTLTPAEQGNFLAALQVANQQLATPEVREAVKTELAAAGMPTAEADIDAAIQQIAMSYETPAGARELMDRATAEGWFDPAAAPGWNNEWRVKFEQLADAQGMHPGTGEALAQIVKSYGASEEELTALHAFYSSSEGKAQLKEELGAIESGVRTGDTMKTALTGGIAVLSV